MRVRIRLKDLLEEEGIAPALLVRTLRGEVAQASVYALLKSDQVKRVDLHTLSEVLCALRFITGRNLHVSDLLEECQDKEEMSPELDQLLKKSRPVVWDELAARSGRFSEEERTNDEAYWLARRADRERMMQLEQSRLLG